MATKKIRVENGRGNFSFNGNYAFGRMLGGFFCSMHVACSSFNDMIVSENKCEFTRVKNKQRGKALRVIPRGKHRLTVYRAQQVACQKSL